jgi:CheY-like chemotaxis protein
MNFLIADDNQINRQFLRAVLGEISQRISEASNGHEAIERCSEQQFDLVFMDIRMPEMDGIEATRQIRQLIDHDPERTCIIALTADLQLTLQDQLLADGFNACLTKPISRAQLLDTVQRVQNGLCLEPGEPREGEINESPVDLEKALAATGGNRELLLKLTDMFVAELRQMLPIIRSSISAADFDPARECAHKLRASAGYCGAISVQQAAAAVEAAVVARDNETANLAAHKLQQETDRLLAHVSAC